MQLNKFDSNEAQVNELATQLAIKLRSVLAAKGSAVMAVSGGKSPIKLFEKLSHEALAWDKVTITLVDERFLPTNHPDSNENLVRKHFLINNAENAFFVGLYTENDILKCVNNANLHVHGIDIAILGMGEDGHTASIFPCCDELKTIIDTQLTTEEYVITTPKNAPYTRIGLSLKGILDVKNLFISINGDKKLSIIQDAAKAETLEYPISFVLYNRPDSQIFWHA